MDKYLADQPITGDRENISVPDFSSLNLRRTEHSKQIQPNTTNMLTTTILMRTCAPKRNSHILVMPSYAGIHE